MQNQIKLFINTLKPYEGIPRCFNIKLLIINMDIEHIHLVPVSLCRYWSTSEFHIFPLGSNNGIAHSNLVSMPSLFQTLCFTISMFSLLEQGFKLSYCHPHSSSAMQPSQRKLLNVSLSFKLCLEAKRFIWDESKCSAIKEKPTALDKFVFYIHFLCKKYVPQLLIPQKKVCIQKRVMVF